MKKISFLVLILSVSLMYSSCSGSNSNSKSNSATEETKNSDDSEENSEDFDDSEDSDEDFSDDDEEYGEEYDYNDDSYDYNNNQNDNYNNQNDNYNNQNGNYNNQNDNYNNQNNNRETVNNTEPPQNCQGVLNGSLGTEQFNGENCMVVQAVFDANRTFQYQTEVLAVDLNGNIMPGNGVAGYCDWYGKGVNTANAGMKVVVKQWIPFSSLSKLQRGSYYFIMYIVDPNTHQRYYSTKVLSFNMN